MEELCSREPEFGLMLEMVNAIVVRWNFLFVNVVLQDVTISYFLFSALIRTEDHAIVHMNHLNKSCEKRIKYLNW